VFFQPEIDEAFWGQVPAEYLLPLVEDPLHPDMKTSVFALGDPHDDATPAVVVFSMPAGGVLPRHSHPCHRMEIVLKGSLIADGDVVLGPGDIMTAGPDEMYAPHRAGPDGYIVAEYFTSMVATYVITWDTPRGPRVQNVLERAREPRRDA
jgi:hypothetical protein